MDIEYQAMMLDRQCRLIEALERAQCGQGTDEDWAVIRFECGVPARIKI